MKSQSAQQSRVRNLRALALVVASSFAIQHWSFSADAPTLIPFQARLTNQQGVAYPNGTYTITFNIYSDAVGGSTNWTERHEKVGVVNGMVNVFLGSIQPFTNVQANPNDDVDFSTTRYLGITVDADDNPATADPEMVPRQMIIPAFFAKNSQNLAGYNWTHILAGGSNNPQTGFLNGGKIQSGSITNVQIGAGQVLTANLGDGQVTGAKLAAGAADGAISDESITSAKIKNGEVATVDLANNSVTLPKLGTDTEARLATIEARLLAIEKGEWSEVAESLGQLPLTTTAEINFDLPASVPVNAKQVLVYCNSWVGGAGTQSGASDTVYISIYTKAGITKYSHRHAHITYNNSSISFNSSTFWMPITSDRKVYAKANHVHSTLNSGGGISVIGWR